MLSLKPTATASDVVAALRDASREAGNVLGGGSNAEVVLVAYRKWANEQSALVNPHLTDDEIARVISTPRYWSLHGIDVGGFDVPSLAQYVRQELSERIDFLNREAQALADEVARWNPFDKHSGRQYRLTAVVLDTHVMIAHHSELATIDWHSFLDELPGMTPLGLALPIQVVRELDRMKMANNNNVNRATKEELRKDAGKALRLIEEIDDPTVPYLLRDSDLGDQSVPAISLLLVADRVPGQPIAEPDAEIVDRAASLLPFANGVFLLSYDAAIVFRARLAGVVARKLKYGWDKPETDRESRNGLA